MSMFCPREWNPERVLEHRHWRWLARRLPAKTDAERQIDALVYELYGLTPEEIKLVQGVP